MKIKNLVAKVIGIGNIQLLPGTDYVEVPDELVYVPVFGKNGEKTGEEEILPSLRIMERLNQIVLVETKSAKPAKKQEPVKEEAQAEAVEDEAPVAEKPAEKKPRKRTKKAE